MSTAATPTQNPAPPQNLQGESRIVIRGISWDDYEDILRIVGDRHLHLAFVDGDLEMMSPSIPHEVYRGLLSLIVRQVALAFRLACRGAGSTTFKKKLARAGIEPDSCFYFARASQFRIKTFDPGVGPYPDLAIEVDIAQSSVDKLKIYAALVVPEIWHSDSHGLHFLHLQPDGTYTETDRSVNLPMLAPAEVWDWTLRGEQADDETAWLAQLQDWVRDVLVPRHRQEG